MNNQKEMEELARLAGADGPGDKRTIHKCILGLNGYAAQLAARGREKDLPALRRIVTDMVSFWGLSRDFSKKGYEEMEKRYGDAFDHGVSAARDTGHAPEVTEQVQNDVFAGLELYVQEMIDCGGMGQWITECGVLAVRLRAEWGRRMTMERGMTFG